jgi:hypothetical protein
MALRSLGNPRGRRRLLIQNLFQQPSILVLHGVMAARPHLGHRPDSHCRRRELDQALNLSLRQNFAMGLPQTVARFGQCPERVLQVAAERNLEVNHGVT